MSIRIHKLKNEYVIRTDDIAKLNICYMIYAVCGGMKYEIQKVVSRKQEM
jgi:hypothetical protein